MRKTLLILVMVLNSGALFSQLMIVGPDAPHLNIVTNGSQITISLYNPPTSNNYLEQYAEVINDHSYLDPGYTDSILYFQGYQIYQVLDNTVTLAERFDTNRTRLVWQCDINDAVGNLMNEEMDSLSNCLGVTKVLANNIGIIDSFTLTINPFTHQPYVYGDNPCFYGKAYAFNPFMVNPNCSGIGSPFFENSFLHHKVCLSGLFDMEHLEIENLNIFPNSASEYFQITGDFENSKMELMNMQGQILMNKNILPGERISVEGFSEGIYVIKLISNGAISYRRLSVNK